MTQDVQDASKPFKGKVDMHSHILPRDWPALDGVDLRIWHAPKGMADAAGFVAKMEWKDGRLFRKVKANCFDPEVILSECDAYGVAVQVMCTVPVMFNYHLPPTLGAEWSRFLNDDLAQSVAKRPDRLIGLGTLPMQDPDAACKEMKRAVLEKGLRGFQIGSHINAFAGLDQVKNVMLSDKSYMPIWQCAKDLDVGIFVHPWDMEWCDSKYWLPWLVGMPAEVSLAMCSVMLGGVLERSPGVKFMFAHGGGSFPGTVGRVEWGYKCRPDLVACDSMRAPREVLKQREIYVDSICHDPEMLRYIVDLVGPERVAMGSDYPFPLGEVPSVAPVTGEKLTAYPGEMIEKVDFLDMKTKMQLLRDTALEFCGVNAKDFSFDVDKNDQPVAKRARTDAPQDV